MESIKIPLIIDGGAEAFACLIERVLRRYGCFEQCALEFGDALSGERVFRPPLRLGELLDHVNRGLKAGAQGGVIAIGSSYVLDMAQGVLRDVEGGGTGAGISAGREIFLTDKECELLQILQRAEGALVARDVLLEQVWGYAPGVETHTVETHIYRLRQKIEIDPADPQIIVTEGAGYYLALADAGIGSL